MVDGLALLDRRITDALAALRCARAAVAHSANSRTRSHEDLAERTLNGLLDQRLRAQMRAHTDVLTGATAGSPSDR
jgi:hypothetical protein